MAEPRSSAAQEAVKKELDPSDEPVVDILGLTVEKRLDRAHIGRGRDLRVGVLSLDELHLLPGARHRLHLIGL